MSIQYVYAYTIVWMFTYSYIQLPGMLMVLLGFNIYNSRCKIPTVCVLLTNGLFICF